MNIIANLVNSRAVDLYNYIAVRYTADRLAVVRHRGILHIAVRRPLATDEVKALVGFIASVEPKAEYLDELKSGLTGIYEYAYSPIYRTNGFIDALFARNIAQIYDEGKGLA